MMEEDLWEWPVMMVVKQTMLMVNDNARVTQWNSDVVLLQKVHMESFCRNKIRKY
jgi:hypothetical protein